MYKFIQNKPNELYDKIMKIIDLYNKNDLVRDKFKNFNLESIICKRTINSKNPASKCKELLITNYCTI